VLEASRPAHTDLFQRLIASVKALCRRHQSTRVAIASRCVALARQLIVASPARGRYTVKVQPLPTVLANYRAS